MKWRSSAEQKRRRKARLLGFRSYCFYCQSKLEYETATLDHVMPKSRGGTNRISNLVLACAPCNKAKGSHV